MGMVKVLVRAEHKFGQEVAFQEPCLPSAGDYWRFQWLIICEDNQINRCELLLSNFNIFYAQMDEQLSGWY